MDVRQFCSFGMPVSRRSVLVLAAGTLAAPAIIRSSRAQGKPWRIGVLQPLTGGAATAGAAAIIGIQLAVDDINAAGGIAGRRVEQVVGDDQSDPTIGVGLARKMIGDDHVDVMLGPQISQIVLGMLPIATQARIPQISGAGAAQLTPETGPYHFSLNPSANLNAVMMASQSAHFAKDKKVAFLSDAGAQSKTTAEVFREAIKPLGLTLTGTQQYQYRAPDMTPQLLSLKGGNPSVIALSTSSGEDTATVAKGLSELGWEVPVVGNVGVGTLGTSTIEAAGSSDLNNFYGITFATASFCAGQAVGSAYGDLLKRAQKVDAKRANMYVVVWYDALQRMKQAIEAVGSADGSAVAKWFVDSSGTSKSVMGTFDVSATNHFLWPERTLTFVRTATTRPDGSAERLIC